MKTIEKIDLHIHTVASDGTDGPAELLSRVKEAGITLFSVTDHDAIDSCSSVHALLRKTDPAFIYGVEFSCRDEGGKYHILGYGYDPKASCLRDLVEYCHTSRINRLQQRLDYLALEYGFTFAKEDTDALFALRNPGKPHIGNLMVKYGYVPTKEIAIQNYLNKHKENGKRIRPEDAISAINGAGGIPVLAHPCLGSGAENIAEDDMKKRLEQLIPYGLKGVEAYYSGFTPSMQVEILTLAEEYGLYVTAGSDYHGTNKPVHLGYTHLDEAEDHPQGLLDFLHDVTVCRG